MRKFSEALYAIIHRRSTDPVRKCHKRRSLSLLIGVNCESKNGTTTSLAYSIPYFVYSDECNVDQVMYCRNDMKDSLMERGISLTFMPFLIKTASRALEQYSQLNAWVDEKIQQLQFLDNHNVDIAIDTSNGLVVPNIENVQNLSIFAIAQELNRLQQCGSKASISYPDVSYTTFTLSNIDVVSADIWKNKL
ncbi:Lipoamide acyltransferase [Cyphomyrmex costatus]|uniref:Lipoamide acyltransferase n=1 Tax=Cyphomyrmex costatus TaxID=456900 RepID=A0A195CWW0_9HYME|nr:Lipoamide acyltransferase [Cyphomyrmex costatus]